VPQLPRVRNVRISRPGLIEIIILTVCNEIYNTVDTIRVPIVFVKNIESTKNINFRSSLPQRNSHTSLVMSPTEKDASHTCFCCSCVTAFLDCFEIPVHCEERLSLFIQNFSCIREYVFVSFKCMFGTSDENDRLHEINRKYRRRDTSSDCVCEKY